MTVTRLMCEEAIDNFIYDLDEGIFSRIAGAWNTKQPPILRRVNNALIGAHIAVASFIPLQNYVYGKTVGPRPAGVSSPEVEIQKNDMTGVEPSGDPGVDTLLSTTAGDLKGALTNSAKGQEPFIRNQTLANIPATKDTKLSFNNKYFDKGEQKYNSAGFFSPKHNAININPKTWSTDMPQVMSHEASCSYSCSYGWSGRTVRLYS